MRYREEENRGRRGRDGAHLLVGEVEGLDEEEGAASDARGHMGARSSSYWSSTSRLPGRTTLRRLAQGGAASDPYRIEAREEGTRHLGLVGWLALKSTEEDLGVGAAGRDKPPRF